MTLDTKKILLVDNDPLTIQGIRPCLESNACVIEPAADGLEALEKIRKDRPDLIVYDVLAPKMSGLQFLEALKAAQGGRRIPIILLSSRPSMEQFFQWMDIDCFLAKPLKEEDLLAKISKSLGRPMHLTATVPAGHSGSGGASIASTAKRAIVVGVEEFILRKLVSYLESSGFDVEIAMDEEQTMGMISKFRANMVFVQYWEDLNRLNAGHLGTQLVKRQQPFIVYSATGLVPDAMKYFSRSQVLAYTDSSDLIRKAEAFLLTTK